MSDAPQTEKKSQRSAYLYARSLEDLIDKELKQEVSPLVRILVKNIVQRHAPHIEAILFYGSCLRDGIIEGQVVDFYVVAQTYLDFHKNPLSAFANAVLPPNVYYMEVPYKSGILRAKYAVVSQKLMQDLARDKSFMPYFWVRFAQPMALVYTREDKTKRKMVAALKSSLTKLVGETLPLMPPHFTSGNLWVKTFRLTYKTEFRVEKNRGEQIYHSYQSRFDAVLALSVQDKSLPFAGTFQAKDKGFAISVTRYQKVTCHIRWYLRSIGGKALHVMRLIKAAYTFDGALAYVLWKIQKHTRVKVEATSWQHRHPLISSPHLLWRFWHKMREKRRS